MGLKLKNVSYKNIVDGINLEFENSSITGFIGKPESDKSSILNLIYGINRVQNGEIAIANLKINRESKNKQIEKFKEKISYLTQDYEKQLFNVTVLEDIKYSNKNLSEMKLYELLEEFNLSEDILDKNYQDLSSGEQKKVILIGLFLKKSKVILLDNPTINLDSKSINNLIKILKREKREGKVILIASTDSEFLLKVSDDIVVLDNNLLTKMDKKEILSNESFLNKINMEVPKILKFRNTALKVKNINLPFRDNINDLIKDIYRNAK